MTRTEAKVVAELFDNDSLPWKTPKWPQYPTLRSLPTIGDGSCLIHAVYGCLAPQHRNRMCSDDPERYEEACDRVRRLRSELAKILPEYYEELPYKEFTGISIVTETGDSLSYDVKGLQRLIDSERYLGEEFVVFLSLILSVNIIILDKNAQTGYMQAVTNLVYDKERKGTVIVLYDDRARHFEAAGIQFPNGHVATHFHNENRFLDPFKRLMRWE